MQREQAELIRTECDNALQSSTPELYVAITALQSLSKLEMNELKSLKNPPAPVKLLMEGVCQVLGVEPSKFKAKDGSLVKDYWAAAIGKNLLGNPRFVETLSTFDSTTLSPVS